MTNEEMAEIYAKANVYHTPAKRGDGTEFAKEVSTEKEVLE